MNTHINKNRSARPGFTLVELLVVIAVIGVLMALLIPAVQMVREAARGTQCKNRMRQVGLGLHMYHDTHDRFPAGWNSELPVGEPGWGWAAQVLPYVEYNNLATTINYSVAISDPIHEAARETVIPIFLCPSDHMPQIMEIDYINDGHSHSRAGLTAGFTADHDDDHVMVSRCNFSGVFGSNELEDDPSRGNGTFYHRSRVGFKSFRDGTSNTIIVGERKSELGTVTWVGVVPGVDHPMARIVGVADHAPNDKHSDHFEDFGSHHPTGANFLSGDCSVRIIHDQVDPTIFQGLATVAGGEVVFYDED